jgi:hypothetical protein
MYALGGALSTFILESLAPPLALTFPAPNSPLSYEQQLKIRRTVLPSDESAISALFQLCLGLRDGSEETEILRYG